MLSCYIGIWIFVFGMVFGSFLNCTAMRIVRHEDFIRGRSHCMTCGHELAAADLIPVMSRMWTRGRCRYCGARISVRYPLTEVMFALLAEGVFLRFGCTPETIRDLVMIGCLFVLSLVDLESYEIPDGCLLIGLIAWCGGAPFIEGSLSSAVQHLLAGLVCGGVMLTISLAMDHILGRESLGGGDIKLYALMGVYTGFLGSYFVVLLSCVFGLILAFIRKLLPGGRQRGEESREELSEAEGPPESGALRPEETASPGREEPVQGTVIPLGPAIAAAGYVMLLFGNDIIHWYLGFF